MEPNDGSQDWENLLEEDLLRLVVSGDGGRSRLAIEEILRREYDWVRRVCSFVNRDTEMASDCLQEALLEIARSLPRFRGDSALRTWMFVIVRRLSRRRGRMHWLRERRFPLGREEDAAHRADEVALDRSPEAEIVLQQEQKKLWSLVRELPEKQRLAVMLHYAEDMSVAEVAGALECSESAVKTHLSRAREKLRKQLAEKAPGEET